MRRCFIVFALVLSSLPAAANECDSAVTQTEMNMCADLEFRQVDSQLNEAYQELRNAYKTVDGAAEALRNAQRAWVSFRDADCAMTRISSGGSVEKMVITQCLTKRTAERLADFRRLLSCNEGDFSCIALDAAAD
jgi:uncharacterized protein YecT (DUF1311 family)